MVRRRFGRLALASLVSLGVVASVVACQFVSGIERVDKVDPVVEAQVPEAAPPPDPCAHLVPPPPPDVDDAPNEDIGAFYLGLRTISLTSEGGALTGFDLDRVCSCDTRPGAAFLGGGSCVGWEAE